MNAWQPLVWHPERFHGAGRSGPFFEGWYYNFARPGGKARYAIIAGVFLGDDSHAFIQMLDGARGTATYHRFAVAEFASRRDRFEVRIGDNLFSTTGLTLSLPHASAELRFTHTQPWPWRPWSPSSMGPLSLLPFLPCYHHVLSLGHDVTGWLRVGAQDIALDGARGYLEKNWGRTFPKTWVWLQSNHLADGDARVLTTFAQVPLGPWRSRGLTAALAQGNRLYRFTTANGGHVVKFQRHGDTVDIVLSNFQQRLCVHAVRVGGAVLLAPTAHGMQPMVRESLSADMEVRLESWSGRRLFEDRASHAAMEIRGEP